MIVEPGLIFEPSIAISDFPPGRSFDPVGPRRSKGAKAAANSSEFTCGYEVPAHPDP